MVDSVIPGEAQVCIWDVSPFIMVTGIGQVKITEFREWLNLKAPSLRLIAIARAVERKYIKGNLMRKRKVLYLKFWNRSHAASFWYTFQDAELMEKDMRIHGLTMKEFKALKKRDLVDYWDVELAGKLNPLGYKKLLTALESTLALPSLSSQPTSTSFRYRLPADVCGVPIYTNTSLPPQFADTAVSRTSKSSKATHDVSTEAEVPLEHNNLDMKTHHALFLMNPNFQVKTAFADLMEQDSGIKRQPEMQIL
ncbi:hypothetical protein EV360DRAFT_86430 [Lentinula raphanica]|nr:hypothetical protein EV360DRAFT_86430 [Lentinula raphanica]